MLQHVGARNGRMLSSRAINHRPRSCAVSRARPSGGRHFPTSRSSARSAQAAARSPQAGGRVGASSHPDEPSPIFTPSGVRGRPRLWPASGQKTKLQGDRRMSASTPKIGHRRFYEYTSYRWFCDCETTSRSRGITWLIATPGLCSQPARHTGFFMPDWTSYFR